MNLGWKLAQVANQTSPGLLDTYHAERHPVAARVLRNALAQIALLQRPDREHVKALRDIMSELHDVGAGHPLLGRRMPDLDLVTSNGPQRMYALLHDARPVLLNFEGCKHLDLTPRADRIKLVNAKYLGQWVLPDLVS